MLEADRPQIRLSAIGSATLGAGGYNAFVSRGWFCLLFAVTLAGCISAFHEAAQLYLRAAPLFSARSRTWYEMAVTGFWFMAVAGAVAAYGFRKWIGRGRLHVKEKERWRDKRELRWTLYAFATTEILQLPIAVIKAYQASRRPMFPIPRPPTFWSEFQSDTLICVALGVAVIVYDRRRLRREEREDRQTNRRCVGCGYDLRATPNRCPECGAVALPLA